MASKAPRIKRNSKGVWCCRAYLGRSPGGKLLQRYRSFPEARDYAQAKQMADAWIDSVTAGGTVSSTAIADLLSDYVDGLQALGAADNSIKAYRTYVRHVARFLRGVDAREATVIQLDRFEQRLLLPKKAGGAGLGRNTVIGIHHFLTSAWRDWCNKGICESNPMLSVAKPKPQAHEAQMPDMADIDKIGKAMEFALCDAPTDEADMQERAYVFGAWLALYTGMRVGEVCAVRRRDVIQHPPSIHVGGTVVEPPSGPPFRRERCKNGKSRKVEVGRPVLQAIRRFMDMQEDFTGAVMPPDAALVTVYGAHIRPTDMSRAFSEWRRSCGLKDGITFHSLRHAHATMLLASGANVKGVSERLGHADVATTLRIYAHVIPGRDAENAEIFARAVSDGDRMETGGSDGR